MGVSGVGVGRGLRTMGAGWGGGRGGGRGLMTKNRRRGWGVRWAGDEI